MHKKRYIKFNKYLSEEKDLLKDFLYQNKGKTVMIDAPTGAGKTKVISQIFHESADDEINILIVPNRVQAEQNASDINYPLFPIVSKSGVQFRGDCYQRNYSAVFDKCSEIKEDLERLKNDATINVICDEFHMLSSSSVFRKDAVLAVLELLNFAKSHGYCGLMSATPKYERAIKFDDKIYFRTDERDFVNNITILVNRTKKPILSIIKPLLLQKSNNAIIRYSNKDEQKKICESFSNKPDIKVAYVNSDEKTYTLCKGKRNFTNKIYQEIIEESKVKTDVNYLFTTSLLDCGTSIKESPFEDAYFIVNDPNQMSINSIIQFANRIRHKFNNFYILINDYDNESKIFKSFNTIYKEQRPIILDCENRFKIIWESIKGMPTMDEQTKIEKIKENLNYKNFWECNVNSNCIFFDEEKQEVYINELAYNLYIQNFYNRQFNYNISKLRTELKNAFNKTINIEYIDNIDTDETIDMKAIKEERKREKQIVIDALKTLTKHTCYKLYKYLDNTTEIEDLLKPIFENQEYKKYLIKAKNLGISSYNIWNILQDESKTKAEIKYFFLEKQIKNNNMLFAIPQYANLQNPIYDNISIKEQAIILRELYQKNKSGNLKKSTIKDDTLTNLVNSISNNCNKKVTKRDVIKLIKMIFVTTENDKGELVLYSIKI